jgi:hypothetical protein
MRAVLALALCLAAASAGAAEKRLYPSGPPHGVAYLRFANLSPEPVKIRSAAAELALPAAGAARVGEYDPVTPGEALTGIVELAGKTRPLQVTLAPNEFVTVAIGGSAGAGPEITLLREVPSDFDALKSALALYNLDKECAAARLVAADGKIEVIAGVAPDKTGRRLVNPVAATLAVACGSGAPVPVELGRMAAGERYSVFLYAASDSRPQVLALRDEMAPFRP